MQKSGYLQGLRKEKMWSFYLPVGVSACAFVPFLVVKGHFIPFPVVVARITSLSHVRNKMHYMERSRIHCGGEVG